MHVVTTPAEMQRWSSEHRRDGHTIGFVPTMGALHEGHTTLLETALSANDCAVLSVFVNPLQFNVASDFDNYPRTLDSDLSIAQSRGVDCVFIPAVEDMYPPGATVKVRPGSAADGMEGENRPGHFEGVTTIVAKLFNCVLPDRAYFGKKDYQQLAVIRQMVNDLDFPIGIVGVETVREPDGLAMSSRNVRLTPAHRRDATVLSAALNNAAAAHAGGLTDARGLESLVRDTVGGCASARLEYVSVVDRVTLGPLVDTSQGAVACLAVWFGDVRLIDNVELHAL